MSAAFASGRIIDVILALMAVETLALLALRARLGAGPSPCSLLGHLAAGMFIMIALRGALTGASWPWVAAPLAASLGAHLVDQICTWRTASR